MAQTLDMVVTLNEHGWITCIPLKPSDARPTLKTTVLTLPDADTIVCAYWAENLPDEGDLRAALTKNVIAYVRALVGLPDDVEQNIDPAQE